MRTVLHQHPWSFSDIVTNNVINLHFFESHLNGLMYVNFLRDVLPQLLKGVPLNVIVDIWMKYNVHLHIMRCVLD